MNTQPGSSKGRSVRPGKPVAKKYIPAKASVFPTEQRTASPITWNRRAIRQRYCYPTQTRRPAIVFGWYGGKFSHLQFLPLLPATHHYCGPTQDPPPYCLIGITRGDVQRYRWRCVNFPACFAAGTKSWFELCADAFFARGFIR